MLTIRQLNRSLRERWDGIRNIRHYQQLNGRGPHNATLITVDQMPNTNNKGRIFAGYTDDLREAHDLTRA